MNEVEIAEVGGAGLARRTSPTASGMVTAAGSLLVLGVASVVLLIPTVFFLVPISPEADAVTLCVPGIGPLQRFRDDLQGDQEEVVFIHERAHAEQCRKYGATWYARRATTRFGRLTMEAQALCAEVAVLSLRGGDRQRLLDRTVETLVVEYFEDGAVPRREISTAVHRACGALPVGGEAD
jgi:hypothetical protein